MGLGHPSDFHVAISLFFSLFPALFVFHVVDDDDECGHLIGTSCADELTDDGTRESTRDLFVFYNLKIKHNEY